MGALDRLLRNPKINRAYSNLNTFQCSRKSIHPLLQLQFYGRRKTIKGITAIKITEHAHTRWNERVGPFIENSSNLEILLSGLIGLPDRLTWISHSIGLIDNDIVFIGDIRSKELVISTFYGRKALHPALNQFQSLKKFNVYSDDHINLSICNEVLGQQVLPPIPVQILQFSGRKTDYCLECYSLVDGEQIFLLKTMKYKIMQDISIINLEKPFQPLLNRSVLFVLHRMGYKEFVLSHLTFHKPESVKESFDLYRKRLSSISKEQMNT